MYCLCVFFFKQKTAYEMRISDWSSDVCSSDLLPFEEVVYWDELRGIFDWSQTHVHGLFALCWGAQAALYHFHGIPKHQLPEKRFGEIGRASCRERVCQYV